MKSIEKNEVKRVPILHARMDFWVVSGSKSACLDNFCKRMSGIKIYKYIVRVSEYEMGGRKKYKSYFPTKHTIHLILNIKQEV